MAYWRHYRRPGGPRRSTVSASSEALLTSLSNTSASEDILLALYRIFDEGGPRLRALHLAYRHKHGDRAGGYLEKAMGKWRSGRVRVSTQTMQRLEALLPPLLSAGERHDLIKKLYNANSKNFHRESFELVVDGNAAQLASELRSIEAAAIRMCEKPLNATLPPPIASRMQWICNDDALASAQIIKAVEAERSMIIAKAGRAELQNLLQAVRAGGRSTQGSQTIAFPYGSLFISIRHSTLFERVANFFK